MRHDAVARRGDASAGFTRRLDPLELCRKPARRGSGNAGFTLLEILVAMAIVAIVFGATVGPFARTIATRDRAEAVLDHSTAARLTLERIGEELENAVPTAADNAAFTLADASLDRPASELRFATRGARRLRPTAARDPVDVVRYRLEPDPAAPRRSLLVKDQLPSLASPGAQPATLVVLRGVVGFRAQVRTGTESAWLPEWVAGTPAPATGGTGGGASSGPLLPAAVGLEILLEPAIAETEPEGLGLVVTVPLGMR